METKSITYIKNKADQDGVIIGQTEKVEFETFNPDGAIFFQKENRGFIVPINKFSAELTSSDIEKFSNLFWGKYAAKGTNRLELPGTRRKIKEMDRAELSEAMGFEGKTAVTKGTSLLNKFIRLGVLAKKTNGQVEEWYANPLLIKTSHRLSVDLFELFQPSLEEAMKGQSMILGFLKAAVQEKYTSRVTTMSKTTAKREIAKEQYKEMLLEELTWEAPVKAKEARIELVQEFIEKYANQAPDLHLKKLSTMTHEEAKNILAQLEELANRHEYNHNIVDIHCGGNKYRFSDLYPKKQWEITDEEKLELEAATSGVIYFTKKASAPTEAKRIS